jgi:murein DD-endopeptidase
VSLPMKKFLLGLALLGWAYAAPDKVDFPAQIQVQLLQVPIVAPLADGDRLLYEIILSNYQNEPYQLQEVAFLDQEGKELQNWAAKDLAVATRQLGQPQDKTLTLSPGRSLVLYCSLPASSSLSHVRHRFSLSLGGRPVALEDAGFAPRRESAPNLTTPFGKGGGWAAVSTPENDSPHRRTIMALHGQFHISQRYAIDWVLTDDKHQYFRGDGSKNSDHYCYGVPALAVADGTVVDLQDGLAEGPPSQSERPYPITPRTIGGNWVALEIAPGRYAMYAHMQPGSLRVKKGEKVRRGQTLGLIGNSGNTTAPHLHLHVSDRPDWVDAEGVPYQFDAYRRLGTLSVSQDEKSMTFTSQGAGDFRGKLPVGDALVEFPEEKK